MQFSLDGKSVFAATGGRDLESDEPVVIFVHGACMAKTV